MLPLCNGASQQELNLTDLFYLPQETPPLDLENVSETLLEKNIKASQMKFGFLGLGIMGSGIVKNLLNSGHKVVIWNRTAAKVSGFSITCGDGKTKVLLYSII